MSLSGYPKVFNLGTPAALGVFSGDYCIEEKIDGSQFSFGVDGEGVLHCRSKGAVIDINNPPNLFATAVDTARQLAGQGLLSTAWTYRAEAVQSKRHNAITYGRAPDAGMILFDIQNARGMFIHPDDKHGRARLLGLECVQRLGYEFGPPSEAGLAALLHQESMLGGAKVEGVVFKNYSQPSAYGPMAFDVTFVKYVNPAFRELNDTRQKSEWSMAAADVVGAMLSTFNREAIWKKAVQHLGDDGQLQYAPQDIPALLKEINIDFESENRAVIEAMLYKKFRDKIMKGLTAGFAEWWKAELAKSALAEEAA